MYRSDVGNILYVFFDLAPEPEVLQFGYPGFLETH